MRNLLGYIKEKKKKFIKIMILSHYKCLYVKQIVILFFSELYLLFLGKTHIRKVFFLWSDHKEGGEWDPLNH